MRNPSFEYMVRREEATKVWVWRAILRESWWMVAPPEMSPAAEQFLSATGRMKQSTAAELERRNSLNATTQPG